MNVIFAALKKTVLRANYLLKVLENYDNPLEVLAIAAKQEPKQTVRLGLRGGTKFFTRKMLWDFFVLNEILIKKEYQVLEKDFSTPKTIIDVGSHIGAFAVFYAKKFPQAKFYCFEPMPDNFGLLEKNISANGLNTRIKPFNLAVTGKKNSKELPLYLCEQNPACNSLDKDYALPGSKKVMVKTTTLAEIFSQNDIAHCDILKLDCENAELEILLASAKELSKTSAVILEYHDQKKLAKIRQTLESAGFEFTLIPDNIIAYAKRKG